MQITGLSQITDMKNMTTKTFCSLEDSVPNNKALSLNGYSAIQSGTYCGYREGSLFLEENSLLFIMEGCLEIRYGSKNFVICKNQFAYLTKNIILDYKTIGGGESPNVEYVLVSLKYELIEEFLKLSKLSVSACDHMSAVTVNSLDRRLLIYIDSLESYLSEPGKVAGSLIKIKVLELLFCLADNDLDILKQILNIREYYHSNITRTVEENIMNSLSLGELAVLSGRSLSSFRRDFYAIYNMPPSQWIRQKRLLKAQELLLSTTMTVTNIGYTLGFDSIAHFSRLFKSHSGCSPSEFRSNIPE